MDMIECLYGREVKGIPLITLPTLLDDPSNYMLKAGALFVNYNDKIIPLGCIKDLYTDIYTGKKISYPKISNACLFIRGELGIECLSQDCITCHKKASLKAFENKLKLLKK